jgi:hypothetical protein
MVGESYGRFGTRMEDVDLSRLGDFEIRLSLGGKRNDAMFLEVWEVMC